MVSEYEFPEFSHVDHIPRENDSPHRHELALNADAWAGNRPLRSALDRLWLQARKLNELTDNMAHTLGRNGREPAPAAQPEWADATRRLLRLLEGAGVDLPETEPELWDSLASALPEIASPGLARRPLRLVESAGSVLPRSDAFLADPRRNGEYRLQFIRELLLGHVADEAGALAIAQRLGLDFTPPRAVILIDAAEFIVVPPEADEQQPVDLAGQRRIQQVIASVVSFFELPNDTICAHLGGGEIAILKASNTRNLPNWTASEDGMEQPRVSWANLNALKRAGAALLNRLRRDTHSSISIGIGRYHPGLRGLADSYQDARAALSLGQRFRGPNQVYCLDSLGIAAFVGVADERTKIDLATHLLSPLDSEPELLKTLQAYFAQDCAPSATANRLSIHRNTLSYRLDKTAALTGLDPRRFDDAVQIRLALALRTLQGTAA